MMNAELKCCSAAMGTSTSVELVIFQLHVGTTGTPHHPCQRRAGTQQHL